jgi:hypothetical protein
LLGGSNTLRTAATQFSHRFRVFVSRAQPGALTGGAMEKLLGSLALACLLPSLALMATAEPSGVEAGSLLQASPVVQGSPRVRGASADIVHALNEAALGSSTFRQLIADISATDGIVYVHRGMCGRNVLACLLLNVTKAGANRILHIKVDPRKRGTDLMVTIGHELSHALELLRNPGVVDARSARLFFDLNVPTERLAFETTNAIQIEWQIDRELRQ